MMEPWLDKYLMIILGKNTCPSLLKLMISARRRRTALAGPLPGVESTLQWTDLRLLVRQTAVDIPELKCRIDHLIQVHPMCD